MTSGSSTSADVSTGNFFTANDPKLGFAIALLANTLQVGALLVEASDQLRSFLFLVSLLGSVAIILWIRHRWPKSGTNTWVYVTATLVTIGLFVGGSIVKGDTLQDPSGISPPPGYYVRLSAYAFDVTDGDLDVDQQLTEIPIVIRDRYKHRVVYKTRRNGTLAILQTYGPILVGACGLYHAHILERENDSEAKALVVHIGIDATRLTMCKE